MSEPRAIAYGGNKAYVVMLPTHGTDNPLTGAQNVILSLDSERATLQAELAALRAELADTDRERCQYRMSCEQHLQTIAKLRAELAEEKRKRLALSSTTHSSPNECSTWYDGCNCTVETLEAFAEQRDRAERREAGFREKVSSLVNEKCDMELERDQALAQCKAMEGRLAEVEEARAYWKANHDNQAEIKRALCVRADMPAHDGVRQLLATAELKLAATEKERDEARAALARMREALDLIAKPKRADGTYNRCREACEQLAREALSSPAALPDAATGEGITVPDKEALRQFMHNHGEAMKRGEGAEP